MRPYLRLRSAGDTHATALTSSCGPDKYLRVNPDSLHERPRLASDCSTRFSIGPLAPVIHASAPLL